MSLTFNESLHEYRYDGKVVPSVTQLIEWAYNFNGVPESVLEYKSMLGTAVHKACELYDLGTLDESSVDPVVAPYLEAWKKFTAECKPEWDAIERRVYHPIHRYAGTLDRRGYVFDGYGWVDIKTSTNVSPATGLQLAGYALADIEERRVGRSGTRNAIQLLPNGTWRRHPFTDPLDAAAFLSTVTLRNWRAKHGT